jgi:hypothetical protein
MYPFYLGIDLHLKRSYVVLMNAEGEVLDKRQLKNHEMSNYLEEQVPAKTYAVMEAPRSTPTPTPLKPTKWLRESWMFSWKTLKAGDKVAAEPGVPHTYRCTTNVITRAYNTHQPALDYSEYFEQMSELVKLGILDSQRLSFKAFLHLSILTTSYPNEIYPVKPPAAVMRLLATIGRMLGYGRVFSPTEALQT